MLHAACSRHCPPYGVMTPSAFKLSATAAHVAPDFRSTLIRSSTFRSPGRKPCGFRPSHVPACCLLRWRAARSRDRPSSRSRQPIPHAAPQPGHSATAGRLPDQLWRPLSPDRGPERVRRIVGHARGAPEKRQVALRHSLLAQSLLLAGPGGWMDGVCIKGTLHPKMVPGRDITDKVQAALKARSES